MQMQCAKQQVLWSFILQVISAVVMMIAILALLFHNQANAQTYYLGVLAPQGESVAQQRWQPWLDTLNTQLSDDIVVLVPLALENWQEQIEAQQFAFVLGPQVQFIKMDTMGWRWLATLQANTQTVNSNEFKMSDVKQADFKTDEQYKLYRQLQNELALAKEAIADKVINQPSAMEQIASVLWVKADSDIEQLRDLKQRKVVAVDPDAFAGYLLVAHLLQQNGVLPSDYETQFVGYPIELTLSTLASGAVDAAIAPLCLMEEMAGQGKIDQSQYRPLNPVATDSNCQSSTKIYPNWTLAATSQAPIALTEQINQYLFAAGAQSSNGSANTDINNIDVTTMHNNAELRWLAPESNSDAERILYEMQQHPAQKQLAVHIVDWIKSHRWWMSIIVFIIVISTINYGWMSWLAWRRRQQILAQNRLIRDYDQQLRQSERFAVIGEMSGAIAHEINQPLATIQNYAQGLLIRSQDNRMDKQTTEKETVENALQQIVNETERAADVISNIRHWAGRSQPNEVSVDIAATYEQCMLLLGEKAVGITFWFASDYQQLRLPSLLLDQLLINSVLNAQQQQATHIMLRCEVKEYRGARWLALHVTDDAGGFNDAQLMKNELKDKPHRYANQQYSPRSTKADGLGLGLMICQRLCKSLDGTMEITNVNARRELATIQAIDSHYQHRLKQSVYNKAHLIQTESSYLLTHELGAQVSFYLPLSLVIR
ncbi:sensor histidine kinase [Psychrobacter sp. DAB_AL62B]|uniref:sensor histidine kinase n=1 Tax=Psychrobacter sp. DAB_AL62B TaxID=1028420 RepID=UPI002380FC73|nr:PhnD/SsuA/transferrin family substrate-binding protein [Psychrobacter sp. DAB_AL62B]MDE4454675.1 hypothetical protein [Psychrobacter sp. DAB_AL62B]